MRIARSTPAQKPRGAAISRVRGRLGGHRRVHSAPRSTRIACLHETRFGYDPARDHQHRSRISPCAVFKSKAAVAALLALAPRRLRPRRRHPADRHPDQLHRLPGGGDRRRRPATSPCSTRRPAATPRDRRRRHHHQPALRPATRPASISSPTAPSTSRRSAATTAARATSSCPISPPSCRAAPTSSPSSVSRVGLRFADGQYRASTTGAATAQVLRSAATLPEDIRRQITRERKPGDADAAVDPMADPEVRAAVRARQLRGAGRLPARPPTQLAYNATR